MSMSKLNFQTLLFEHFILVNTKTRKVDQLGLDTGLLRSPAAVVPERLGQILGAGQQPLQVVPAKNIRSARKNIWLQTEKYLHEVLHQRACVEPPPINVGDSITSWVEIEFYWRKYILITILKFLHFSSSVQLNNCQRGSEQIFVKDEKDLTFQLI